MTDTMEVEGVVYGAPIDGFFDGQVFPDGLKDGDELMVRWAGDTAFAGPYPVPNIWAFEGSAFRAPVDHPIYATKSDGYGPEIKVDGMPIWLADDEQVIGKWTEWYFNGPTFKRHYASPSEITAIRLPADHWAYPVIAKGFKPWAGGDDAPVDWAPYGEVLFADNSTSDVYDCWDWSNGNCEKPQDRDGALIIGYRRRVEPEVNHAYESRMAERITEPQAPEPIEFHGFNEDVPVRFDSVGELMDDLNDRVTIPKMTEDEVRRRFTTIYDASWDSSTDDVVTLFRELGIIKPEPTPIEKFEAHHGGLDDNQRAILEIYQEWIAAQ